MVFFSGCSESALDSFRFPSLPSPIGNTTCDVIVAFDRRPKYICRSGPNKNGSTLIPFEYLGSCGGQDIACEGAVSMVSCRPSNQERCRKQRVSRRES